MAIVTHQLTGGILIEGKFPEPDVLSLIESTAGKLPLTIADPPYGNIVDKKWDKIKVDDNTFASWMIDWTKRIEEMSLPGSALYVWGGVGKPKFRPFYRYMVRTEVETGYLLANHITWGKKRAYGVQHNYLFCREEIAYLCLGDIKKPRVFNIPLLDKKRGYAGYDKDYPAKSEFLRRTNVWTDITEIFRGKIHINEKPEELMRIIVDTHTNPGEYVLDTFAGSGTTAAAAQALGRKFILVENDPESIAKILKRIK